MAAQESVPMTPEAPAPTHRGPAGSCPCPAPIPLLSIPHEHHEVHMRGHIASHSGLFFLADSEFAHATQNFVAMRVLTGAS